MDIRQCEICGTRFIAGYGYSIAAAWYVTGHAHVASFMCEKASGGQHWGCSPEHAVQALMGCLTDHLNSDVLLAKYAEREEEGKSRFSVEDRALQAEIGESFPFVKVGGA